jgi:hypothetical protein
VPLSNNIKGIVKDLPIVFLDTYCFLIEALDKIQSDSSYISNTIDVLGTKIDHFCINHSKSATVVSGMVGSYIIGRIQPIESLVVLING